MFRNYKAIFISFMHGCATNYNEVPETTHNSSSTDFLFANQHFISLRLISKFGDNTELF